MANKWTDTSGKSLLSKNVYFHIYENELACSLLTTLYIIKYAKPWTMNRNVFPCTWPGLASPGKDSGGRGGPWPRGWGVVGSSKSSPEQFLLPHHVWAPCLGTLGRSHRTNRTQMTRSDWTRLPGASVPGPDIEVCCSCVARNFGLLDPRNLRRPPQIRLRAPSSSSSTWLGGFETKP